MAIKSAIINVMERAARKAARGLLRDLGEVGQLQVSQKGPANFVSAADIRAEKTIRLELAKARPDFGFLLEESGEVGNKKAYDPRTWGKSAEEGMGKRVVQACEDLRSAGTSASK